MNSKSKKVATLTAAGAALIVVSSTGGAVASSLVTSSDIKDQTIQSRDIRRGGVGKSEIRRDSVGWYGELNQFTRNKIRSFAGQNGQDGQDGADGPVGPQGPQGPQGPEGPQGPAATVGLSHWSEGAEVAPGEYKEVVARCQNSDHLAISGGYTAGSYKSDVHVVFSYNTPEAPTDPNYASGWKVGFRNDGDALQKVRTWVVCADVVEDEPAG